MLLMQAQENRVVLDEEQLLFIAGGQDSSVDEDVDEPPVQDLALNVDNVFQADKCDAFDSDVDEAPTAQTMFMANLSSADPVYDKVGPLYDSDILSEVHDHDNYQDAVCEHHEVHEMHDDYVKDNAEPVVQNNISFVPNDAYMMIINKMHEQTAQCVSVKEQNKVVDASLTAKLATYKEQVELFTEMHDAHTVVQARCLKLEAELSRLNDKIQKYDHNELVKHFSKLEVNHLNLQLKYQHLKESFGNNKSLPSRDAPDFDSVFVIKKMKASIQGKDNAIKKLRMQISQLKETRSEAECTLDFRALDFLITQLTKKVTVLQEQNDIFRAENAKIKQHYKELYDSTKITRAKHIE
ncbi:hypothetical protein Tco_0185160 [Tanacetum coccineum]